MFCFQDLIFLSISFVDGATEKDEKRKRKKKNVKKLVTKKIASDPLFGRLSFDFFSRIEREIMWSLAEKKAFLR